MKQVEIGQRCTMEEVPYNTYLFRMANGRYKDFFKRVGREWVRVYEKVGDTFCRTDIIRRMSPEQEVVIVTEVSSQKRGG